MHRLLLLLILLVASHAAETGIVDMPVRYINRDMITYQDLQERVALGLRARNARPPQDMQTKNLLLSQALDALTEEILLIQEAEKMGIHFPQGVVQADVRREWEEKQQVLNPQIMAELVRQRMRSIKIQTIMRHYLQMAPSIRPKDIEKYYEKHQATYKRPARWHLYQIMVLPADQQDRVKIFNNLRKIFTRIVENNDEKINAVITEEKTQAYLKFKAGSAEQISFLSDIAKQLLAVDIKDPGPVTRVLLEDAKRWSIAADALRDKPAVVALMNKLHAELSALEPEQRIEKFQEFADSYSVGLGAKQGGDLGLVELATQNADYQAQLEKLNAYELSPVFWSGKAAVLLMATTKEAPQIRTFNEVNGEIRKLLENQQQQAVRMDLVKQLKSQAAIIDIKQKSAPK